VQAVLNRGNAAHDLPAALGQEVLGLGVLEEGILRAGERHLDVEAERRHPDRIAGEELVGQIDERLQVPA
jgi:hypothetical protein